MKKFLTIVSIISTILISRSTKISMWETSESILSNIFDSSSNNRKPLTPIEVASVLIETGFPKKIVPIFTLIAKNESSFRPWKTHKNRNKTIDHGLLQINDIWLDHCKATSASLRNPAINARCALEVYRKQGLHAWSSYHKVKREMNKKNRTMNKGKTNKNRRKEEEFIVENDR